MRQAIETKYIAPTNHKGTRVKAVTGSGLTLTVGWDYALSDVENHRAAAVKLCEKLKWPTDLIGGSTVKGFVFVQKEGAK